VDVVVVVLELEFVLELVLPTGVEVLLAG